MAKPKKLVKSVKAEPLGLSSYSISNLADLNNDADKGKRGSRTELLRIVSRQQIALQIEAIDEDIASMRGPLDLINWSEIALAKTTILEAVARTKLFEVSQIDSELLLAHHENGKWDPIYTLWLNVPHVDTVKLDDARSVGVAVLRALGSNPNNPTPELPFDRLSTENAKVVQDVAMEVLIQSGGRDLKNEIVVFVERENRLALKGKLAAKPDRADFNGKETPLFGTIRGFINDHKQHSILLSTVDEGEFELNFLEKHLGDEVNLQNLVKLNLSRIRCEVQTKKTISSSGKNVYAFISIKVASDEKRPEDLLTPQIADSVNNEIEKSIMSSNES